MMYNAFIRLITMTAKDGGGINLIFKATSLQRVCPPVCVWLNHCYPTL